MENTKELQTLQEENRRLRRAVEELSILNDLARLIGGSLNSHEIMQTIIHRSLRAVHAEQGIITLVDEQANKPMKTLVRSMVSSSDHAQFHLTDSILGWMHLNKKPLMINDPTNDDRFRGIRWDHAVKSVLCVPLVIKSLMIGILTAYNKKDGQTFTDDDQRLMAIIAAQSAQVVENARLYEQEKSLTRMQEELRLASQIQINLLPKHPPKIPGYDIAAISIPAQLVGGDYFDYIPMDENRIALCLGDVSGKGLPAAMLMANLQATLRGQTLVNPTAKDCIQRSNRLLSQSTSDEKFATVFFGILDISAHWFIFSNAGHDSPFFLTKGKELTRLRSGGIPLGVLESFAFTEELISFSEGDTLVIYSDGVPEAWNTQDVPFGEEKFGQVILQHSEASAMKLIEYILLAVREHVGDAPQMDDITIMVIKRTKD